MGSLTTPRVLVAESIGTFALVFAGCGAIMVDAKTGQLGHLGVAIAFGLVINEPGSLARAGTRLRERPCAVGLPRGAADRCHTRGARLPVRSRRAAGRCDGGGAVSNVLFVCVANSGRSVLAERLFRAAAGGRHAARSAGSRPGTAAHPDVVRALAEVGLDATDHVPRPLDDAAVAWADVVVATCDDACPVLPGKRYVNWQLTDPKELPLDEVRALRDDISARVSALLAALDGESAII